VGAQQALNNQANMAWNKGVGGLADGGGFMSSGRNAQLGQAQENAATQLGNQQQMLAYNAAQAAAQAGQQAGMTGYQGKLSAGNALVGNALNASGQTGAMQNAQLLPGQTQAGVGAVQQNQNQNQLNATYNNDINKFQNPFKALQNYQAGLGVLGSSNYAPNINMPNNIIQGLNMLGINPTSAMSGLGQAGMSGLGDMLKSIFGMGTNYLAGTNVPSVGSGGNGGSFSAGSLTGLPDAQYGAIGPNMPNYMGAGFGADTGAYAQPSLSSMMGNSPMYAGGSNSFNESTGSYDFLK